ncbi:hypothetical protein A5819_003645 [Enterococcus sp. 7E2_DIV0204]|uniref:hypothetical protein n=2 Tax=unclassified Enterococcus TaxID=2608891 RepID=UPI000A32E081|nr:hypothetical protein [Enterococcus sp. 7E2_DIV0204]OTN83826.1 hypothetical protein A5819_003645 [Enterococcus sp. 7E2_DIV0204]
MKNIKTIEEEIEKILIKDKRSWVRLFELIREVELGALWKPEHLSFTRWIRHLAYESGVTESLIWKRKKAGEIYFDYQTRAKKKGLAVPRIEDVEVSPDNFELVEKISQGNKDIKDDLMDKVLHRELKRSELLSAWKSVKTIRQNEPGSIIKKNSHSEVSCSEGEKEIALSVSDIAISLTYSSWLNNFSDVNMNSLTTHAQKKVYKLFPNFSFYSSITDRSHTIDFLVIENSTSNSHQLNLHSIEVILSEEDLHRSFNSKQYQQHMNYLWIAIPSLLVEKLEPKISDDYGIIEVGTKEVATIWRNSLYTTETNKLDLLQTILATIL